jgi:hypothetical protein
MVGGGGGGGIYTGHQAPHQARHSGHEDTGSHPHSHLVSLLCKLYRHCQLRLSYSCLFSCQNSPDGHSGVGKKNNFMTMALNSTTGGLNIGIIIFY